VNRPGLAALTFRAGTWSSFFERMKARLAGSDLGPLATLGTRDPGDFTIALLDAWAAACDVVTFYSERIANEGYLRTAVERRSVVELARLTGYTPRPGLAASVHLAYTMEKDSAGPVPAGSRAQSVPAQGQLPQTFETAETLAARSAWNNLAPRAARPAFIRPDTKVIYLKGQVLNLKPNDPLLLVGAAGALPVSIESVELQANEDRTKVTIQSAPATPLIPVPSLSDSLDSEPPKKRATLMETARALLDPISKEPARNPRSALQMTSDVAANFAPDRDNRLKLLTAMHPELKDALYSGLGNAQVSESRPLEVHGFRVRATPFGASAPLQIIPMGEGKFETREWNLQREAPREPDTYQFDIRVRREASSSNLPAVGVGVPLWRVQVTIEQNGNPLATFDSSSVAAGTPFSVSAGITGTLVAPAAAGTPPPVPLFTLVLTLPGPLTITASSEASNAKIVKGEGISLSSVNVNFEASTGTLIYDVAGERGAVGEGSPSEATDRISLDAHYDNLVPDSWVLVEQNREGQAKPRRLLGKVTKVADRSRADYGISGKSTELTVALPEAWVDTAKDSLSAVRATTVFSASERLELAAEPMPTDVGGARIELDALCDGLNAGRWVIVSGERTDIAGTEGVMAAELVMLAGVEQSIQRVDAKTGRPLAPEEEQSAGTEVQAVDLPDDTLHSFLLLASPLSYTYKPSTVTIYGNVVHATHGETRTEILGSGDGSQALQTFQLRQPPLTYIAAPTPSGAQSTLELRVNGRLWHETGTFTGAKPNDRLYTIRIDDDGKTFVTFGNGIEGARLPTGAENVAAVYRNGLGSGGNLAALQISLLGSRPLGVKEVVNPLPSTGGADREDRESVRRNVPLALTSLDRLVSVQDYADFARTFAGVGKAVAARLPAAQGQVVHVTVAGAADIPIATESDLYQNLLEALAAYGDPHQPVQLATRALRLLVIGASVQVLPDYLWDLVKPAIIAALNDAFGFERRDLGQDVLLSEVMAVIQAVKGVSYVDVDRFATIRVRKEHVEEDLRKITDPNPGRLPSRIAAELARPDAGGIIPAELIILDASMPATLTLTEIKR
jgi:predicted phage baseplate assembly protein